ncbi:MAG TPA: SUMF1/EgtB/PvdO family nonheme iron enzyme, partial [Methylotenera sp.]|nr:SUMF1/EgtB/PvdO family nonheme iron enzyme [Methylotenera sp.]
TLLHPNNAQSASGEVWCWTKSQYSAYPRFKAFDGVLNEYNGKFMCNQFVLRGGCVATLHQHYRHSYRNFYQAQQRWMFSGIRLAKDMV